MSIPFSFELANLKKYSMKCWFAGSQAVHKKVLSLELTVFLPSSQGGARLLGDFLSRSNQFCAELETR
jgi:hypothetical protein